MALINYPTSPFAFTDRLNPCCSTFQDVKFDGSTNTWTPVGLHHHWDFVENPTNYEFYCDLPGIQMQNIDISVMDNVLKVAGNEYFKECLLCMLSRNFIYFR